MDTFNVKELRESFGLSRERFAHKLGVSSLSIFNWEVRGIRPSQLAVERLRRLKRIAERGRGGPLIQI